MSKPTLIRAAGEWVASLLEKLDVWIFRTPDLDALARGWQVHRSRRFYRTYRDPRWDQISSCATCQGIGSVGAHECPTCNGACTIRRVPQLEDCHERR
jgi:hypothetical protein